MERVVPASESQASEENLNDVILSELSSLAGRCKSLEARVSAQETESARGKSGLAKLAERVDRLFAGGRRMQDGLRFVHDKAQLTLRWCVIQIKKVRGEAAEEIPNEEAMASQISPYQNSVSFEDGNSDPSAGASVPEPNQGETPLKKRSSDA